VLEIPHPNPSPPGRGAKTLILRLLPLAQLGRGGWGVRAIELTLINPAIINPAIINPVIINPAIINLAITNPAIINPAITNPE